MGRSERSFKPLNKFLHRGVALIKRQGGITASVKQIERHHCARNRAAGSAGSRYPGAKSGGDFGDQIGLNVFAFGHGKQKTLRSAVARGKQFINSPGNGIGHNLSFLDP